MRISPDRLEELRGRFQAAYWKRGLAYHAEARVTLEFVGEVEARASVRGSGNKVYAVRLGESARGPMVEGFCSCPVGFACKHVVATLHALADQTSMSSKAPGATRVRRWLETVEGREASEPESSPRETLLFVLQQGQGRSTALSVGAFRRIEESEGSYRIGPRVDPSHRGRTWAHRVASHDDRRLWWEIQEAATEAGAPGSLREELPLLGARSRSLLQALVETKRCVFEEVDQPLRWGAAHRGELCWRLEPDGRQTLGVRLRGRRAAGLAREGWILATTPASYRCESDAGGFVVGALELPSLDGKPLGEGFAATPMPFISPEESVALDAESVARMAALGLPEPARVPLRPPERLEPHLKIRPEPRRRGVGDRLEVSVRYDGITLEGHVGERILRFDDEGAPFVLERDEAFETEAIRRLESMGFFAFGDAHIARDYETWSEFVLRGRRQLESEGWVVEVDEDADLARPEVDERELRLRIDEAGGPRGKEKGSEAVSFERWAELSLDVCIDGEYVSLVPALEAAIRGAARSERGLEVTESVPLVLIMEDGSTRVLLMPRERIQGAIDVLLELFDLRADAGGGERLLVRQGALARVGLGLSWLKFHAPEHLAKIARALEGFDSITQVEVPRGLDAELRSYQRRGLDWLSFLRERGLAGILADDMGLGKTVQALAHVLVEFEAGRLDRPVLVVAPRSVLVNWEREAGRFAPELAVVRWHGQARDELGSPDDYHVVVTSYATLLRDEALREQAWHLVILDEAQAIKNPASKTRRAVRELETRHRLAMTGTPVENHLLELWSIFDVLMPGYLGSRREFMTHFRTPIERNGDAGRMRNLQRRVAPFLLRRTKGEVLPELPPKTEVIDWVQLEGEQSDLYESVRAGLERSVRQALTARGLTRSQIVVLDALLKLRQVCCDPRLVKLERARSVTESAKLERLLDRLEVIVASGQRALVFSQFATMLGLIEEALKARGLPSQKLTGRTRKRQPLIDRFQSGDVPIFLISLKAGGTGLNLTAADVVIHYDPWWNPAAEDQATDRAHRIGQDKPVTVYKMVVAGSVEAAILDLQARKAQLAAQVQEGARALGGAIRSEDLDVLFAPLDGGRGSSAGEEGDGDEGEDEDA